MPDFTGGWGGIRTPGGVAPTTVFKTVAIDRSATHPKLFYRRSFNLRFCSLTAPGGAAHHSFALDCADACLADSYARPSQSTAVLTHPKLFTDGLSAVGFVRFSHMMARRIITNARIIQYWGRVVNSSVGGKLLCLRTRGYMISLPPWREPTQKGDKTWLNLFW